MIIRKDANGQPYICEPLIKAEEFKQNSSTDISSNFAKDTERSIKVDISLEAMAKYRKSVQAANLPVEVYSRKSNCFGDLELMPPPRTQPQSDPWMTRNPAFNLLKPNGELNIIDPEKPIEGGAWIYSMEAYEKPYENLISASSQFVIDPNITDGSMQTFVSKWSFDRKAEDIAATLLDGYAKAYAMITQGYEDGTRRVYIKDEKSESHSRQLTLDEELSNSDRLFKNLTDDLEKLPSNISESLVGAAKKFVEDFNTNGVNK